MNTVFHIIKSSSTIIDHVIHISDIHFTMKDKYDHYENVFNNFMKDIKQKYQKKNTIIIITGDIFNEKNKLDSKLVLFAKNMIYSISKLFTTFIICGNHDFIQQNRKIPDTLTSVFYDSNNENDFMYDEINDLYYLKNTGYYIYNNIGFGVLSIFDIHDFSSCGLKEGIIFPNGKKLHDYFGNEIHTNLALLHTTVKNSSIQTHEGYDKYLDSYDNHIDVKDIENYDYILLGDIHKQQFINNAGYPSSLVQQNFGEDPVNHGYILWDLKNKKYEFIRVDSDYGMIKCKLSVFINSKKQKKVNIHLPLYNKIFKYPSKLDLKIIIEESELNKFIDEKHSKDDLLQLIKEWFSENKLNILNLEIIFDNPKIDNISEENAIIDNSIDWLDIKTIEKYLKEISNDPLLIEEYKKIHELVMIKKIKNESKNWKLLTLEWNNLFSYGEDNSIDFTKENINIILGENFTGKSSILDVLIYTIYGSVYRCDKLLQIINVNQKSGYSSLSFQYGNIIYKIERYLKKKITKKNENHSQKIYVKKIVGNDISNIILNLNSWTGEKLIETPEKIDDFVCEIFGTKNNFLATYILNQSNNNSFVHMKNTERKELLESWLQLDLLEESRKQIKIWKKEKEDEYNKLKGGLDQCIKVFENIKKNFDIDNYEKCINELNISIENYNKEVKEFEEFKMIECPSFPYINFHDKKYGEDFLELIEKYKNNIMILKNNVEYVDYDDNMHTKTMNDYNFILKELNEFGIKLKSIQTKFKTFGKIEPITIPYDKLEIIYQELTANIDITVDDYFKDKNNYIPHNRNKSYYLNFLGDYNIFKDQYSSLMITKNIDSLQDYLKNIKYKRHNIITLNNRKNELSTNIKLFEQKLNSIQFEFIFNIENIDIFINNTNQEICEYWKLVSDKCDLLNIKINKNDHYFTNSYYDNLLSDIETWEIEQNKIKEKYKNIISLDICKRDKIIYENLNNELKNTDNNLNTLSKFKFSKSCECCIQNMSTLKLDKYLSTKNKINQEIDDLNKKYGSYDRLLKIMNESEEYNKWNKDYKNINLKNEKLKEKHAIYIELKRVHNIYVKLKEKLNFYLNEKENINLYNEKLKLQKNIENLQKEYDNIEIIDISELSEEINDIENILQRNDFFEKELREWNKYVDRFDIYDDMLNKQKNNISLRSKISDIQNQMKNVKIYEYYTIMKSQIDQYENEILKLNENKNLIESKLTEFEKLKEKYLKNKKYQEDIVKINDEIYIMDLKWKQYLEDMESYKIKSKEYLTLKSEYEKLKLKHNMNKENYIKNKVQLDLLKDKQKQYLEIKNDIDIKNSNLFEVNKLFSIYCKLNEFMSINGYNYWIYKNIVPILNNHTNNILKNIVDFTCDIELISDNVKSTSIDIYIQNSNNNIKLPIKMSSGFQQQIVSIAIRIALINLSNNKGSSIFMDESFSSFDIYYQAKIPDLLKYFSKTFDNIWIISHIENLQKDISGKYIVKRTGLYSKVNKV